MRFAGLTVALAGLLLGANVTLAQEAKENPAASTTREWEAIRGARILASPDRKAFLVYGATPNLEPSSITLYDAANGEVRWRQDLALGAYVVRFSPNGKWLADRPLRFILTIRAAETGEKLAAIDDCADFAFTADSKGIVYRDQMSGELIYWNIETKSVIARRALPKSSTYNDGILIPSTGDCIAVSGWDERGQKSQLMSFRLPDLNSMATYTVYARNSWALTDDGKSLIVLARYEIDERSRRLIYLSFPELKLQAQVRPCASITCYASLPGKGRLLIGTSNGICESQFDGKKLLLGESSGWETDVSISEACPVDSITLSQDQRYAAVVTSRSVRGTYGQQLRIFDLTTERQVALLTDDPKSRLYSVAFVDGDRSVVFTRTRGFGPTLKVHAVQVPLEELLTKWKSPPIASP